MAGRYSSASARAVWTLVLVLAPCSYGSAEDQIYKYLDDTGTLNFTSEWSSIPEKYRRVAERLHPVAASPLTTPLRPKPRSPEVRTVQSIGEYRMSNHDT